MPEYSAMTFETAFNLLAPEAQQAFASLPSDPSARLHTVNTLVRASLVHDYYAPASRQTDCTGAMMVLNALLSELGFTTGHALLVSLPWQSPDNKSGIHMLSTAIPHNSTDIYYADPTALPGYLFGTSGKAIPDKEDILYLPDELLGTSTIVRLVTEQQVAAIHTIKVGRATSAAILKEHRNKLEAGYHTIKDLGAYAMHGLLLFDRANNDPLYSRFNANLVPEAIQGNHHRYIRDKKTKEYVRHRDADEEAQRKRLAPLAGKILLQMTNIYEINYWTGVQHHLKNGAESIARHRATEVSWTDFMPGSERPIETYEKRMLAAHPGFCKSSLYAPPESLMR